MSIPTSEATISQKAPEETKTQQSKLKPPTKLETGYLQIPTKIEPASKLTLKERRETTMKSKKDQKPAESDSKTSKKQAPVYQAFHKYKTINRIEFPIEGKLIVTFSSNLILA